MRIGFWFLCINILAAAVIGLFTISEGAILLDKVVAVVNSEVITWSESNKSWSSRPARRLRHERAGEAQDI